MIALSLRTKHSNGVCTLDIWRDEHGSISMCVFDSAGGPQFDFELSDGDVDDFVFLLGKARAQPTTEGEA